MQRSPLTVFVVLAGILLAAPVLAQGMPPAAGAHAAKRAAHAEKQPRRMRTAKAAARSCMDYAWQSQDQKDCEAGKIKPPRTR